MDRLVRVLEPYCGQLVENGSDSSVMAPDRPFPFPHSSLPTIILSKKKLIRLFAIRNAIKNVCTSLVFVRNAFLRLDYCQRELMTHEMTGLRHMPNKQNLYLLGILAHPYTS
ncbi:hypothetical protein EVAR_27585_1 [Eumeta japonica]|uniref:Uncharacterized protein n=1 Tax=Eumeta variegata TaxID=151549 RepID=A0A4C1W9Y6_EUMVA|nr:hypothetical protein EVAR_27585_1 [Eumeta japonica]